MSAASLTSSMSARWRRWLLPALLALTLLLLALVTVRNQALQNEQAYDLESVAPQGLRALRLWLVEMGYDVTEVRGNPFDVADDVDLLFVYPGLQEWSNTDLGALRRWLLRGGTAALIAPQSDDLLDALVPGSYRDFAQSGYYDDNPVRQVQPLLPASPATWQGSGGTYGLQFTEDNGAVPLLATERFAGGATLGVHNVGAGTIWIASNAHTLTNSNLEDATHVAVLAALLRTIPDGGKIAFDSYHLYGAAADTNVEDAPVTLQDWLYTTAGGRAVLFALAVGALYWVLAGRRLGPPLPAQRDLRRREGAEYVRALAGLKRRAQTGNEVAQHQRQRLKVALGKPRHIAATLPDADFLHALRASGDLESADLHTIESLLARLHAFRNEQELVAVAAAVDEYLNKV